MTIFGKTFCRRWFFRHSRESLMIYDHYGHYQKIDNNCIEIGEFLICCCCFVCFYWVIWATCSLVAYTASLVLHCLPYVNTLGLQHLTNILTKSHMDPSLSWVGGWWKYVSCLNHCQKNLICHRIMSTWNRLRIPTFLVGFWQDPKRAHILACPAKPLHFDKFFFLKFAYYG